MFLELSKQQAAKRRVDKEWKKLVVGEPRYTFVDYLLEEKETLNEMTSKHINTESNKFPWIDCELDCEIGNINDFEPEKKEPLDVNIIVFDHSRIMLKDKAGWNSYQYSPFDFLKQYQLQAESSYIIGRVENRYFHESSKKWLFKIAEIFDVNKGEWIVCNNVAKSDAFDDIRKSLKNPIFTFMAIECQLVKFAFHYTIDGGKITKDPVMNNETDDDGKQVKIKRSIFRGNLYE